MKAYITRFFSTMATVMATPIMRNHGLKIFNYIKHKTTSLRNKANSSFGHRVCLINSFQRHSQQDLRLLFPFMISHTHLKLKPLLSTCQISNQFGETAEPLMVPCVSMDRAFQCISDKGSSTLACSQINRTLAFKS